MATSQPTAPMHDIVPLPDCWLDEWREFAHTRGLEHFPDRAWLDARPAEARAFHAWLWRQLARNRGRMCRKLPGTGACECQGTGVSREIALAVLTAMVGEDDPTLKCYLRSRLNQIKAAVPRVRRGRKPRPPPEDPNGAPEPRGPLAAVMGVPKRLILTNAIARELRTEHHPPPAS